METIETSTVDEFGMTATVHFCSSHYQRILIEKILKKTKGLTVRFLVRFSELDLALYWNRIKFLR